MAVPAPDSGLAHPGFSGARLHDMTLAILQNDDLEACKEADYAALGFIGVNLIRPFLRIPRFKAVHEICISGTASSLCGAHSAAWAALQVRADRDARTDAAWESDGPA